MIKYIEKITNEATKKGQLASVKGQLRDIADRLMVDPATAPKGLRSRIKRLLAAKKYLEREIKGKAK